MRTIPRPSADEVSECYEDWENLEYYPEQECFLKELFTERYTENIDINEVLIKVCTLDSLYSTNLSKIKNGQFIVAKRIVKLNIDPLIKNPDFTLVSEIASVIEGKNLFSFATKYCSFHFQEEHYPIYDKNVKNMLEHFKKEDEFADFTTSRDGEDPLNQHPKFYDVMEDFQEYYELEDFTLREIEKYLWYSAKYKYKL